MRMMFVLGLFGFAGYLLWKEFRKKDDLQVHAEEQVRLQAIGKVVVAGDHNALGAYPLTTIGDTPFAGVNFDPFNPDSAASMPKKLDMYPGMLSF